MFFSTASVSLPLGFKSLVRPLVEDLFTNHAKRSGRLSRPPAQVPSAGLFNRFPSGPSSFKQRYEVRIVLENNEKENVTLKSRSRSSIFKLKRVCIAVDHY